VLWSLREVQQKKLKEFLPSESQSKMIRIEKFTPQPEVLAHKNVKVFLSHCGWGGVTDATAAGVPILGFPGMQDQFTNARMVDEAEEIKSSRRCFARIWWTGENYSNHRERGGR